jgi:methylated-DNA-[protein]-cysteine S-methyltransferase
MNPLSYTEIESPVGALRLVGNERGLCQLSFVEGRRKTRPNPEWKEDRRSFAAAIKQLREYFAGKREQFDLPLVLDGTPFQLSVWRNLQKIPYGETVSYLDIAKKIGNPQAVRAVGLANGSNPIAIIVPCHRVIGSDGSLTGFGGGLPTKQKLLALESRQLRLL